MKIDKFKKSVIAVTGIAVAGAVLLGSFNMAQAYTRTKEFGDKDGLTMMKDLGLSESQKEQIRKMEQDWKETNREKRKNLREKMDSFGVEPGEKDLNEVRAHMSEMIYQGMKNRYELFQVLTPEQRAVLEKKRMDPREDRQKKRENREEKKEQFKEKLTRELDLTPGQQQKLHAMKLQHSRRDRTSFLAEKLDLTQSQKEQIENILEKHRGMYGKGEDGIQRKDKENLDLMKELHDSPTFDESKARELSSAMAEKMVSGFMERKKIDSEIMQILNEDQKEEFMKMRRDFRNRDGGHRGSIHGKPPMKG